jgi:serine/threonine protein kinase
MDYCNDEFDVTLGDRLGVGGHGTVWACTARRKGGTRDFPMALKVLTEERRSSRRDSKYRPEWVLETSLLMRAAHENVVGFRGMFFSPDGGWPAILMDGMDGDLSRFVQSAGPRMDRRLLPSVIRQLLRGLAHLHGLRVVHRDIKPGNVLYSRRASGYAIKIADLGLARYVSDEMTPRMMTVNYRAPELTLDGPDGVTQYTQAVDVWGVGLVAYELFMGKMHRERRLDDATDVFTEHTKFDAFDAYVAGVVDDLHDCPPLQDFVRSTLAFDPGARPSAAALLEHAWLLPS